MQPNPALLTLLSSLTPEARDLLRGLLGEEPKTSGGDGDGIGTGADMGTGGNAGGRQGGDGSDRLYRQRIYHLVPYGHFEEVLSLCEQLNAIARSRGGKGGTLWIPTIGQQNELIVEFEFNSLATFEIGRSQRNADPEWTNLVRKIGAAVVPGSVRTELVETAPHLA